MISQIIIKNFIPFYGTHTINIGSGIFNILGIYDTDKTQSNRSGKSSFLRAILYALFNETHTNSLVSIGESEMNVTVVFDDGSSVSRGTDGAFLNGEATTHTLLNSFVEQKLHLSKDEFMLTLGVLNGNTSGFLTLTPKQQKDFLLSFTDTSLDWNSMHKALSEKLNTYKNKLQALTAEETYIEEQLSAINLDLFKKNLAQTAIRRNNTVAEITDIKTRNKETLETLIATQKQLYEIKSELQLAERNNKAYSAQIQKQKEITKKLHTAQKELDTHKTAKALNANAKKLHENAATLKGELTEYVNRINEYKKHNGKCPILKEQCPYAEKLKQTVYDWATMCNKKANVYQDLVKQANDATAEADIVSNLEQTVTLLNKEYFTAVDLHYVDTTELENTYAELETKVAELSTKSNDALLEKLEESYRQSERMLSTLRSTVINTVKAQERLRTISHEITQLNDKVRLYTIATYAVSPNGIPYLLTAKILEKIESYANNMLESFGITITMLPYKELQKLETACIVDGYEFKKGETICPICGRSRSNAIQEQIEITTERGTTWAQESSGGKTIIALAIRLAIYKMFLEQRHLQKCTNAFLVLDEALNYLDTKSKESCMEMLYTASSALHIMQIFVVIHSVMNYNETPIIVVTRYADRSTISLT